MTSRSPSSSAPRPAPPRLVVFDLGGVLIRICRTWPEACAAAGLPVRGHELVDIRSSLAHRHGLGELSSDEFFRLVSEALLGAYSADEVRRVHDAWLLGEYPGVQRLIADIHAAGLSTGVLSNTNHAHWTRLAPPGRGGSGEFASPGLVHHLHASHLMRLLKPDAAIYAAFERLTGAHPGEILFFDDLEDNVLAARSRGWQSELVDHTGDTAAQMRGTLRGLGVGI